MLRMIEDRIEEDINTEESNVSFILETINSYSELVQKVIWNDLIYKIEVIYTNLLNIKSPIEQAFYLAMQRELELLRSYPTIQFINFTPQYSVKVEDKTYRIDFRLHAVFAGDTVIDYAIECDGHDFHEKTKEQAKRDRQRERALISAGYKVIRFTGSEIFEDPYYCASELSSIVENDMYSFMRRD